MVDKNILVDHPTAKKLTKGLTRFLIETCMQRKKTNKTTNTIRHLLLGNSTDTSQSHCDPQWERQHDSSF